MHLISLVLRGLGSTQDSAALVDFYLALTRLRRSSAVSCDSDGVCGCCYNYCVYCNHVWTVVNQIKSSKEVRLSLSAVNCSHDDLVLMWPLLQKVR